MGSRPNYALYGALGVTLAVALPLASARADFFNTGDVMASVDIGTVNQYTHSLAFVRALHDGDTGYTAAGSTFDNAGNFYVTNFNDDTTSKFSSTGALVSTNYFTGSTGHNESVLHDAAGNFWIGAADTNKISEYSSAGGAPIHQFTVATESRGTDWIDLASNQTTFYYTSEGTHVKRFDTVAGQLSDFNAVALPGSSAFALRILANGNVLVADSQSIVELDSTGHVIKQYTDPHGGNLAWFALNLDPDGTSFWSGDLSTGELAEFNIATGAVEQSIMTGAVQLGGISVKGEITQANIPEPASLVLFGSGLIGIALVRRRRKSA